MNIVTRWPDVFKTIAALRASVPRYLEDTRQLAGSPAVAVASNHQGELGCDVFVSRFLIGFREVSCR